MKVTADGAASGAVVTAGHKVWWGRLWPLPWACESANSHELHKCLFFFSSKNKAQTQQADLGLS